MTEKFRFSVVIATYNRADYVIQAIQSVREQTYPAYEIIVVDDGGSDGTAASVRQTYPDVSVYSQPNLGPSVAHNSGIDLATGDWICFLDDDDLWHHDKLADTAAYLLAHPDCKAVRNPVWCFAEEEQPPIKSGNPFRSDFEARTLEECHARVLSDDLAANDASYLNIIGASHSRLLECNRGVLSATVVRRDIVIRAGGFSPMQTCGDDWTMFVNVARLCEWHLIPRRLGFTRLHSAQNTADPKNGLYILAGYVNAWFTGRPLPGRISFIEMRNRLRKYGPIYRAAAQQFFWAALRVGEWEMARSIRHLGFALLPRFRDRGYMMVPPQITWRIERYLLGMHK